MCLFCKIINGEIPCYKVYEDNDFLAFLDISQATVGHTLVIPKKHVANVFELDDETASKMLIVVKNVANKLKEKLNLSAVNILNNSGSLAGQTVHHLHIHIIPRYENDNIHLSPDAHDVDHEALKNTLSKILN